jgi:hypothetical protein
MSNNWCSEIRRVAKLFAVEPDPQQSDRAFWRQFFADTRVNCVSAAAGGIMAFYPTAVPFHTRSSALGSRDHFGDLVATAREMGARVIARIDPHATHQDAFDAHPEWIAVDAQSRHRRHWSRKDLWVTCVLGPYYEQFMAAVIAEICERYRPDGFHVNRWMGSGVCYCDACRDGFARASGGLEIPRAPRDRGVPDPTWKAYDRWHGKRLLEIWDHSESVVHRTNPDGHFLPNLFESSLIGSRELAKRTFLVNVDYQARGPRDPMWFIGRAARKVRAAMGNVPTVAGISPGFEGNPYRWKDSVRHTSDLQMWYYDAIANGMRIAWGKFAETCPDKRWLEPVRQVFRWHADNERFLVNTESRATVAVAWTPEGTREKGGKLERESEDAQLGMYFALLEGRIPFDLLKVDLIDDEHLARYRALVLPDSARLSGEQCAAITRFVERGGGLLATGETSLFDDEGRELPDFGLAGLLGVSYRGRRRPGPVKNSYLTLQQPARHPILRGLEDAGRLIHGVWQLDVTPRERFDQPALTLVPSYPDLPMEYLYPDQPTTDIAEVYTRAVGRGKVAYFPWDIDRVFWEVSCRDHGVLLVNSVRWLLDDELPAEVEGPGLVEVTSWLQEQSLTVHLVNLTNPFAMGGSLHELIPVGEQKVRVRVPQGTAPKAARLLVAGRLAPLVRAGDAWEATVPSLLTHEVVAIEL